MSVHGVKRSRTTDSAEVLKEKKAKELKRISDYTSTMEQFVQAKSSKDYSQTALDLTSRILTMNPEFPTGWNQRRRILVQGFFPQANTDEIQNLLSSDLLLTSISLKHNPKNYSVWEHRKWILKTMPDPDWGFELKTVEKLLEKDARNFHGWNYRRYIISSIRQLSASPPSTLKTPLPKLTTSSELAYTTSKISAKFSNFSAWHYRSKLLTRLWDEKGWDQANEERQRTIDDEFEFVKEAMYTDPDDQSAWLYHRWLVGEGTEKILRREIVVLEELLDVEPDSRWCLDTLVHYQTLLLPHLTDEERPKSNVVCKQMLQKLQTVDPDRGKRYRDTTLAHH